MIDLYTWNTPNGQKVSIALEELGLPYTVQSIDITKDQQFGADFLAISPNNKIPAIVDHDNGVRMMESVAILLYLAEKSGRLMPQSAEARWQTLEWLFFQAGGFGPMLGQAHHFLHFQKGKSDYAEQRYAAEAQRLYGVLEKRLAGRDYLIDEYSIADIALWPWAARFEWQGIDLNRYPNIKKWYLRIAEREAVQRGYPVPVRGEKVAEIPKPASSH